MSVLAYFLSFKSRHLNHVKEEGFAFLFFSCSGNVYASYALNRLCAGMDPDEIFREEQVLWRKSLVISACYTMHMHNCINIQYFFLYNARVYTIYIILIP